MAEEYPRDEFDQIAESAGPVGVHRAPRPWWILVVTPVVVFLLAGLLAFLIAQFLWNSGEGGATASPTPTATTATTSPEPTVSASPEVTASPSVTPSPTETAEPEPVVNFDADVAVLNGTGISGLAGGQKTALEDAGFTAVTAANLSGTKPDVNTVVYADDAMADTAQAVADELGFDAVVQGETSSGADVEAQIVTDPR